MRHKDYGHWFVGLLVLILVSIGQFLSPSSAEAAPPLTIGLLEHATGLVNPVDIANNRVAGDTRLFVVEQSGLIKIVQPDGTVSGTFLNIDSRVMGGGEEGLLGLAFHPNYASNGFFYVYYTNNAGDNVVARYSRQTANTADPNSELIILTSPHPGLDNHNGGDLNFGPDGYLYISTGDGGGGGDSSNNAQNKDTLLGKILRIDINSGSPYASPSTNPFFGATAGRDEIWALGLRNPWRFSFDRANGDMYIGDVGQNSWEEIDFQAAGSPGGRNYGWRCYEADAAYNTAGCGVASTYAFPIAKYSLNGAPCAVTGGFVYRGTQFPNMAGHYLYADYCSGDFYSLTPNGSGGWNNELIAGFGTLNFSTFGEDINGEIYVADIALGTIHKVQDSESCTENEQPEPEVFRLYNPTNFMHMYTPYSCEVNVASQQSGYTYEGVAFYQASASGAGTILVHRLYNPNTFIHFWATTQAEINIATQQAGYIYEGPAYYAASPNTSAPGAVPIHRLYNPRTFLHLWTAYQADIDAATASGGYVYEGVAFYAFLNAQ